jgi:hypothetical protein
VLIHTGGPLMQGIDRDARPDHGGVFAAQGVLIRGTVE